MVPVKRLWIAALVCLLTTSTIISTATFNATASAANSKFSPETLIRVASSPVIYVEGTVACGHDTCLKLLRTRNNGESFADVATPPTPVVKGAPNGSWDQLVFANTNDGFALAVGVNNKGVSTGSELYATRNGARTWTKIREPAGNFLSSVAVSSNTLYGVTMHCSKQTNGNEGCLDYRLVHTSLSVQRWTSSPIPNGRSYPWGFLGNVAAYGSMVWLTEGAKWSLLIYSRDRGSALNTLTPKWPALASVAGCDLTAFSMMKLWASCPTGMEVSFSFSDDGGGTWTAVPTDQFMGTGGGFFDPVSGTLAYLDYGGPRSLYRVIDAGHHLAKVGTLQCSKVNFSVDSMAFTSERNGLAVCLPQDLLSLARLERTTDGGTKWSRVVP